MGRCLSPCLNDLDPNLYRERLDQALKLFVGRDGGRALLERVDEQTKIASAERKYERAAWLQRRKHRLESLLERLGGVLRATHTGARLVLAPHPEAAGRFDAIWIAGGRVVDWGPVGAGDDEGDDRAGAVAHARGGSPIAAPRDPRAALSADLAARSARAFRAAPAPGKLGGWLPADAVAEARLVGLWVAANRPPTLELGARTGEAAHTAFLARAGFSTASSWTA
jgi:DNA polymerase-3 subunit epsilon